MMQNEECKFQIFILGYRHTCQLKTKKTKKMLPTTITTIVPDFQMRFGKHKGKQFSEIAREAPKYVSWLVRNDILKYDDQKEAAQYWVNELDIPTFAIPQRTRPARW